MLLFLPYDSLSWLIPSSLLLREYFHFLFFFGKCTYIIFIFHYVFCCTMYVYEAIKSRRTHIIVYLFDVKPRSGVKNCQNKLQPKLYLVYMYINRENGNHHYRHNFCQTITDKNDFFRSKNKALTVALTSGIIFLLFSPSVKNHKHAHQHAFTQCQSQTFSFSSRRKIDKIDHICSHQHKTELLPYT